MIYTNKLYTNNYIGDICIHITYIIYNIEYGQLTLSDSMLCEVLLSRHWESEMIIDESQTEDICFIEGCDKKYVIIPLLHTVALQYKGINTQSHSAADKGKIANQSRHHNGGDAL